MTSVWLNGQPVIGLPPDDRGLAYGDGLFETIRVVAGQCRLLQRHLDRLAEGCRRLGITTDLSLLAAELQRFCAELGDGVCKLILTRGSGRRGYAPFHAGVPHRLLQGLPMATYPQTHVADGVRLFDCATRLAEQPRLAGLKHLNRLEQVLARAEWDDPAFAEGLMRDTSGRVIEGVFSNLFLGVGEGLVTPSLTRCGVAGVQRAEILHRAGQGGISVTVRDVTIEDLARADELFLCNSQYGIWPVVAFRDLHWSVGPLTRKLQGLLTDLEGSP